MKLELEAVINTDNFIGQKVYVCAYQAGQYSRASQNICATECIVASMDEYKEKAETHKNIYYSKNALLKIHKSQKRIIYNNPIQPYAYDIKLHSYAKRGGVSIFDNFDECKNHYIALLKS